MMDNFWDAYLGEIGLTELDALAQSVGWRIRAVNSYSFDLEYQGGEARYYQKGEGLKTFSQHDRDKAEQFLNEKKEEKRKTMGETIDEELIPYLEQCLEEYQRENFDLYYVWSAMYGAIYDWLVEQRLDPETFNVNALTQLVLKAMSNLHMTVN